MLFSKCSSPMGALMAAAIAVVGLSANAQTFIGGGEAPTYSTMPAVSIRSDSGAAAGGGRDIVNIINGGGMTSKVTDDNGNADGSPGGKMALFRSTARPIPQHPGTVTASNWVEFQFDQVYSLQELWIWNYNESTVPDPNPLDPSYPTVGSTRYGWKHLTVQYSVTGGPDPSEWTIAGAPDTIVPRSHNGSQTGGITDGAVDLIMPLGGIAARYVVLSNIGAAGAPGVVDPTAEISWAGDDGASDAGLSEVRFTVPEPTALGFLSFAGVALLRRRK